MNVKSLTMLPGLSQFFAGGAAGTAAYHECFWTQYFIRLFFPAAEIFCLFAGLPVYFPYSSDRTTLPVRRSGQRSGGARGSARWKNAHDLSRKHR